MHLYYAELWIGMSATDAIQFQHLVACSVDQSCMDLFVTICLVLSCRVACVDPLFTYGLAIVGMGGNHHPTCGSER